jgi:hypothetical protein
VRFQSITKRVFSLFVIIVLYSNLYSFDRKLLREISSQNQISTEHFNIYWSDDYPKAIAWQYEENGYPIFISRLKNTCEEVYQYFLEKGFDMPPHIEVYLANSGMFADGLFINDISSWGAFVSDEYPEILINSEIPAKDLTINLKRIFVHEMTHVIHHKFNIIKTEEKTDINDKWFTEGTAVFSETDYLQISQYLYEYFSYLSDNISNNFFDVTNYIKPYANGFLFYYLHKTYNYDLSNFINIYKSNPTPIEFLTHIANEQNSTAVQILTDVYDSFLYQKELYGEEFKNILISEDSINNIKDRKFLKIKSMEFDSDWRLIAFPVQIDDFSIFGDIKYIIWTYQDNKWHIKTNKELNNNNSNIIQKLEIGKGFWIKSDENLSLELTTF